MVYKFRIRDMGDYLTDRFVNNLLSLNICSVSIFELSDICYISISLLLMHWFVLYLLADVLNSSFSGQFMCLASVFVVNIYW